MKTASVIDESPMDWCANDSYRQWYVQFTLMCVGVLSVKTPTNECHIDKIPGSLHL